jgi:hypothetical protein
VGFSATVNAQKQPDIDAGALEFMQDVRKG